MLTWNRIVGLLLLLGLAGAAIHAQQSPPDGERRWLAGDHHVHSRYSVAYDTNRNPPSYTVGGDAIYPIPMNAVMARRHGLEWMVSTDHGGPNHARINLERAYPELELSRAAVPEVVQFYGMEFDTPGADHSSIIVPHSHGEAEHLHAIESRFNKREPWPADPARDTEPRMLEALAAMRQLPQPPVLIAHHPSRSAPGLGEYGLTTPAELRAWNDAAPGIAVGMEGAPGHQAAAMEEAGSIYQESQRERRPRGAYGNYPTLGGYDQMTARLGGFWDSMLSEGRRWWITANSDSHVHWSEGGIDFWPGEYAKTYVLAEKNHEAILDSIRHGRVFVTTGDLISQLWVDVAAGGKRAGIGETLRVSSTGGLRVRIRILDPEGPNFNGDRPSVQRVDLIVGRITGPVTDPAADSAAGTRVEARFHADDWRREGDFQVIEYELDEVDVPLYLRVRGTSTEELEPELDDGDESPWDDLWFYSNPVFVELE